MRTPNLYYFRDNDGKEIDFLLDVDQTIFPLEVKLDPTRDTDEDGLADYEEDINGNGEFDPGDLSDFEAVDTDEDGLSDYEEAQAGYNRRNPNDPGPTLDPVADLEAAVWGPGIIQLSWTYAAGDVDGFRIERAEGIADFLPLVTLGPAQTSFLDEEVQQETEYGYRILAYTGPSESPWSATAKLTTPRNAQLSLTPAVLIAAYILCLLRPLIRGAAHGQARKPTSQC